MGIKISDIIASYDASNFRFRYGWLEEINNNLFLFIIGERTDEPTITVLEELIRGQKYAELRIWYVNLDEVNPQLVNIPYEYPLPISPVLITYDGKQYLYVIYNKYNIWRLDLKGVLNNPKGNYWLRLPPCLDCNFLGDSRTSTTWNAYFIKPNYLTIVSQDGLMARMDTNTFVWFFDKASSPVQPFSPKINENELYITIFDKNVDELTQIQKKKIAKTVNNSNILNTTSKNNVPLITATGLDRDEIYMTYFGSIGGKVMNIYSKNWDDFYFDTRICANANKIFSKLLDKGLYPLFIKRRRLYTVNELGHMFYSWLRIYGIFDVEFQLNEFYNADEIRIYGDYTFLQQALDNVKIEVFGLKSGWIEIPKDKFNVVINQTNWLWDSEYFRRYYRFKLTPNGDLQVEYTKVPDNYLSIDLSDLNEPISKLRVYFKPLPEEYNYIVHINKIEVLTSQTNLVAYDNPDNTSEDNGLEIVRFEPITNEQQTTIAYAIYVKNNSDTTIKNVKAYVYNNQFIQMKHGNEDPNTNEGWYRYNQYNPLILIDSLEPNNMVKFYIRGINIDDTPQMSDVVIIGEKTYL